MGFFLMRCVHHPGKDGERDRLRPQHRDWVGTGGNGLVSVLIGSALHDDAGAGIGNWGVLEARGMADAHSFATGDPFNKAGIVKQIELTALPDGFQAARITSPMSPRLEP